MKRTINPFWLLYLVLVFLPLGAFVTVVASILTIIFSFIGDYRWCYMPAKYWGRILCYLSFVRVDVIGRSNYDTNQSYIFVANHQSIYDIFVLYGWLINKFKWIMKNSLRRLCVPQGRAYLHRPQQPYPCQTQYRRSRKEAP